MASQQREKETHFGFQTVSEEEKERRVYEVFQRVADKYDQMNDLMSLGIHRLWKDVLMERLSPTHGTTLLDVAGGTGDVAFRFVNFLNTLPPPASGKEESRVTVCDINKDMLRVGEERARALRLDHSLSWLHSNAEALDVPDNSYSAYTIAFGMRNVTRVDKALAEAYRVLKPGGRFLCLEFSRVNNEAVQWVYDKYSFQVIPAMGQVVAGDWDSYQYLVESIRRFPDQETYKAMIENAGFWNVTYENLTFGVVAIHSGFKL